jgi:hypothetical protein
MAPERIVLEDLEETQVPTDQERGDGWSILEMAAGLAAVVVIACALVVSTSNAVAFLARLAMLAWIRSGHLSEV